MIQALIFYASASRAPADLPVTVNMPSAPPVGAKFRTRNGTPLVVTAVEYLLPSVQVDGDVIVHVYLAGVDL